jgi:hypothetical protein
LTACCVGVSDSRADPAEVERYLFEPFFSTRSRGTGLGLYICRELCERYRASIEYRADRARRLRNEFLRGDAARCLSPANPPWASTVNHPCRNACSSSTTNPTCAPCTS